MAGEFDDDGPQEAKRPKAKRRAPRSMAAAVAGAPLAKSVPTGVEADDEPELSWDEQAERERRELYAELAPRRREAARIPARWHDISFDDFDRDGRAAAIDEARAWSAGTGPRGLLLFGEVGRGKSRIAAAAAWARCALGPVRWRNVAELLLSLGYAFDHPERERALAALSPRAGTALVLDDLDKTKPTDHALQPLYLAVNAWVDAKAPLIVTCNRAIDRLADDFGERFGSPIASRLAGYCEEFEIGGPDRRLEP
jgi:DNA replication protein DnaC